MPRHGHAQKFSAGPYFAKDPSLREEKRRKKEEKEGRVVKSTNTMLQLFSIREAILLSIIYQKSLQMLKIFV